jgi:hypothetical protein
MVYDVYICLLFKNIYTYLIKILIRLLFLLKYKIIFIIVEF